MGIQQLNSDVGGFGVAFWRPGKKIKQKQQTETEKERNEVLLETVSSEAQKATFQEPCGEAVIQSVILGVLLGAFGVNSIAVTHNDSCLKVLISEWI